MQSHSIFLQPGTGGKGRVYQNISTIFARWRLPKFREQLCLFYATARTLRSYLAARSQHIVSLTIGCVVEECTVPLTLWGHLHLRVLCCSIAMHGLQACDRRCSGKVVLKNV